MKTTFTKNVGKYLLGVLFLGLTMTANAQAPTVTITPTGPIVCAGTKLDVVINNLTGPYTYFWNTGATTATIVITQTGFYRVRVTGTDVNGNVVTVRSSWYPFLVIPATYAVITPNGPTTICDGQGLLLQGSGGQFFSSYSWSTGQTTRNITVNASGDYTLTVTNSFGSCNNTSTATIHVDVFDTGYQPEIHANGPITVCQPGYIHLTADSGFSGYQWSSGQTTQNVSILMDGTGANILDTMTVHLTVQVNATCEFTSDPGLVIRSIRQPKLGTRFCGNFNLSLFDSIRSEVVLTYLSFAPQYEFEFEETTNPGVLWTSVSSTRWCRLSDVTPALETGKFYNVRVRAIIDGVPYCYGDHCQIGVPPARPAGSGTLNVAKTLRMDGSAIEALVYPNPSNESFKLYVSNFTADQTAIVRISDVSGRLVNEYQYDSTVGSLTFGEELTNGIYFVSVEQGDAKSVTRIVKTN